MNDNTELHLLLEARMKPVPEGLEVLVFDDSVTVVDDHGKVLAIGEHVLIRGPEHIVKDWLRPFDGFWLGRGTPALQEFDVAHINDGSAPKEADRG